LERPKDKLSSLKRKRNLKEKLCRIRVLLLYNFAMFFETIAVFETNTCYFLKVIGMKFQCLKLACFHFLVSVCDCTYAFTYLYTLLFLLFFFVIVFDLYAIFFNSAVSVSEVEALFELYKSISSSVVDDGLISKVSLMVFFLKKNILVFSSSVGTLFFFLVLIFSLQQ